MKVFTSGRRTGKTTNAILWLLENKQRVLVLHNQSYALDLKSKYPVIKNQIICWTELEQLKGSHKEIGIDNIDIILSHLIGNRIGLLTATTE